MKHIGIDVSSVIFGTGVSVYTKRLVENLLEIDNINKYTLFGGSLRRAGEIKDYLSQLKHRQFTKKVLPIAPIMADFMWNRLHIFPIEHLTGKLDIYHTSDWTEPPARVAKKVTTIHDFSPVFYPELTDPRIVEVHRRRLNWVKRESDVVIVPSKTSFRDAERFGIDSRKLRIIPESHIFSKAGAREIEQVKEKFNIRRKYFITIGANRRKNTYRLVKAFMKIKRDLDMNLIIVGNHNLTISRDEAIIETGHVTDTELCALISGASVLVYPSLYEGFGLPILEGFNLGVPVVTSNIGSMAEIGANAAILIDPYSVKSIYFGMKNAVENIDNLTLHGKNESKKYSWLKTAKATLDVYNKLSN